VAGFCGCVVTVVVVDVGEGALGCLWARADDESKSRRLELAGLPRDLPFEGLIYARSAVTLAPTFFFGDAALQSRTVRS
jgi:hypothetical protein